jgi:hypothetical protein
MIRRLVFVGIVIAGAAAAFTTEWWSTASAAKPETPTSGCRVGTFKRADVLVAYYGSTAHDTRLKELSAQRDRAKAAGDETKASEIQAQGASLQERAHAQLAGELMISDVLEHLEDAWAGIAQEAGVGIIVEQPLYKDGGVELVDVTPLLVKRFEPVKKKADKP